MNYHDLMTLVYNSAIAVAKKDGQSYRTPSMFHAFSSIKPPWADFTVKMAESSVRDIANGPHVRRHGVLYISLYDHIDAGEDAILRRVDTYVSALEFGTVEMVEFGRSTISSLSDVNKSLIRYVIELPFHTA